VNTVILPLQKSILVIGDSIVDIYVYGTAIGKSAETPTIVAKKNDEKISIGGAFLVVRNLLELGAKVNFVTLVGADEESRYVREYKHPNLTLTFIIDKYRCTTIKKRYWIDGYKLLQIDGIDNTNLNSKVKIEAVDKIKPLIRQCDLVVVSDYRHGFLSEGIPEILVKLASENNKSLYIDSQVSQSSSNHIQYKGATLFCLNYTEAKQIYKDFDIENALDGLAKIKNQLNAQNVVVKLGELGCIGYINGEMMQSSGFPVKAIDTCGAGDAFLAALCVTEISDCQQALNFSNKWAALSTLQHGPSPPILKDMNKDHEDK